MNPVLSLTDAPSRESWDVLLAALDDFNREAVGYTESHPLAVLLSDPASGRTVGGLWGRTGWHHLHIDILVVPAALRRHGFGARLLRAAEGEAERRGCRGAWLDTYSFQARGFYERQGYAVFGSIPDYPPGHMRYFLRKALPAAASAS